MKQARDWMAPVGHKRSQKAGVVYTLAEEVVPAGSRLRADDGQCASCAVRTLDTPKTAWINPSGGHLGRQVKVWPDPRIFNQVIIPWLVRTLQAPGPVT
jgi:hypothetical protein